MSPPSTQHAQLQLLAYTALNTYFTTHADLILEIEVLPPAFEPTDALILEDGANLGMPKKILALAFVYARQVFFAHYKSAVDEERVRAHEATRVMLLFDPEHLTAANYRKRHLLDLQGEETFLDALLAERRFMDSILTSPLHRQSKSPTLWAHRAWWLDLILPMLSCPQYADIFHEELDAAIKSGERHPKNYYAWQYARRVVNKSKELLPDNAGFEDFLGASAQKVKAWCMLHVGDISGFSFLVWVLGLMRSEEEKGRVVQEMAAYAMDVKLANESPWTFVKIAMASGLMAKEVERATLEEMDRCQKELDASNEAAPLSIRLGDTLRWIAQNEAEEADTQRI